MEVYEIEFTIKEQEMFYPTASFLAETLAEAEAIAERSSLFYLEGNPDHTVYFSITRVIQVSKVVKSGYYPATNQTSS